MPFSQIVIFGRKATHKNKRQPEGCRRAWSEDAYFTPCISFWISGATSIMTTPAPSRTQNAEV
jgi:hypothetical protein